MGPALAFLALIVIISTTLVSGFGFVKIFKKIGKL